MDGESRRGKREAREREREREREAHAHDLLIHTHKTREGGIPPFFEGGVAERQQLLSRKYPPTGKKRAAPTLTCVSLSFSLSLSLPPPLLSRPHTYLGTCQIIEKTLCRTAIATCEEMGAGSEGEGASCSGQAEGEMKGWASGRWRGRGVNRCTSRGCEAPRKRSGQS